ncbi:MAG: SGNH/GDSL hydrolase family protein [Clostridiales bacterium]|nr:SGNH/GDSL hydrolase family protein [Clostridiales bacterium]
MKILFQGDSITDGGRLKDEASRWDLNHQIGHTWVYIVTGELMYRYPRRFECVNRGLSSNTLLDLKARWQKDALDIKPDVMMILIGANDAGAIARGAMTPDDYVRLYHELIDDLKKVSPDLGLVILEPFTLKTDPETVRIFDELRVLAGSVAKDYNAVFVPLQDEFRRLEAENGVGYWIWDGIHPTEAGHCMIAHRVLEMSAGLLGIGENK